MERPRDMAILCTETPSQKLSAPPSGKPRLTAARVISTMSVGGVQRGIIETLRHRDAARWNVKLLSLDNDGEWRPFLTQMGIEAHLLPKGYPWRKMFSLAVLRRLGPVVFWLKKHRVSVLHVHQAKPAMFMTLAAKIARVPCILIHHHSVYEDHFWGQCSPGRMRWEKRMTNLADGVIAVSETVAECTQRVLGVPPEKIRIVRNGVAQNEPGCDSASEPIPEIPAGFKIVCGVGRLARDKCWDDFITAAALVVQNVPRVHFWMVGDEIGSDSVRVELEAQVRGLGLADRFHFLGFRTDVARLLEFANAGVLCSRREGCPNALLEYLCAGVPAVVSDIPAITEFVQNGETALVTPINQPKELACSIERVLRDEALAAALAQRGRDLASGFAWEHAARGYEAFYRDILAGKGFLFPETHRDGGKENEKQRNKN